MSDRITISRWSSSDGTAGIGIAIRNEKHKLIYEGEMTFENYAMCISGQGSICIERSTIREMQFGIEQEEST